jgi:flagellar protein FliO/FliZ
LYLGGEKLKRSRKKYWYAVRTLLSGIRFTATLVISLLCLTVLPLAAQETGAGDEAVPAGTVERTSETSILLDEDAPGVSPAPPAASAFLILRMLLVLALAAAAIYGVVFFLKRASRPSERRDPHVKVLSSVHLGSNRFVHVVSVGSRAWFLGGGDSGVNLIAEIEDQDTINALILAEERRSVQGGGKILNFKAMLSRLGLPVDDRVPEADSIRKRRERLKGFK